MFWMFKVHFSLQLHDLFKSNIICVGLDGFCLVGMQYQEGSAANEDNPSMLYVLHCWGTAYSQERCQNS